MLTFDLASNDGSRGRGGGGGGGEVGAENFLGGVFALSASAIARTNPRSRARDREGEREREGEGAGIDINSIYSRQSSGRIPRVSRTFRQVELSRSQIINLR